MVIFRTLHGQRYTLLGGVYFTCSKFKLTARWYKAVLFDKCYCVCARVYMSVMFIYTYKYTYNMAMLGIF